MLLVLVGGAAGLLQQGLDNQVAIPGTESQEALDRLAATFPQVSGASAQVIVVAPDGDSVNEEPMRSAITEGVDALGDVSQVEVVTSPYDDLMPASVSDDERATLDRWARAQDTVPWFRYETADATNDPGDLTEAVGDASPGARGR